MNSVEEGFIKKLRNAVWLGNDPRSFTTKQIVINSSKSNGKQSKPLLNEWMQALNRKLW